MIRLPGNECELLMNGRSPVLEVVFPEIGCSVRARIVKVTFTQLLLLISEVCGKKTQIEYRAVFRPTEFDQTNYLCDKFNKGDVVECIVTSYGDLGIFVTL